MSSDKKISGKVKFMNAQWHAGRIQARLHYASTGRPACKLRRAGNPALDKPAFCERIEAKSQVFQYRQNDL